MGGMYLEHMFGNLAGRIDNLETELVTLEQ
jgi:hypothetical protein